MCNLDGVLDDVVGILKKQLVILHWFVYHAILSCHLYKLEAICVQYQT